MIEIKGLYKYYGKDVVLKDIYLKIERGERFVIIGPTGAGKTTLLRLLNLIERPSRGDIYFDGVNVVREKKIRLKIRRRMAMVPQKPAMFSASVRDNCAYGLRVRGERDFDEKVMNVLKVVGLDGCECRNARTLSGGEAKRLAIARALVTEPEVLLLDEPTADLDPVSKRSIEDLISRIVHEYDITMIMVTHDLFQGKRFADRIAFMRSGEIVQVSTADEIFSRPASVEIASFVGVENILSGVVVRNENGIVEIAPTEATSFGSAEGETVFAVSEYGEGTAVNVFIRPEDIILVKSAADGAVCESGGVGDGVGDGISGIGGRSSARNVIRSRIEWIAQSGPGLFRVRLMNGLVAFVTAHAVEDLRLREGDEVYAIFKATAVHTVMRRKQ